MMRILVHDYAGHPFQAQLSRELAKRKHVVLHAHCASLPGAKGAVERAPDDPERFDVAGVGLARDFDKYSLWRRPIHERAYARELMRSLVSFDPDVVISANTPLLSQRTLLTEARRRRAHFIFWQQDILSMGIAEALRRRLGSMSGLATRLFVTLEQSLLRRSDAVVVISEDFRPVLRNWGVPEERVEVIPNWAPLDELPSLPRENDWAKAQGLDGQRIVLYAGTLGLKHDPSLLLETARRLSVHSDVRVVVVASGVGAAWLNEEVDREGLENLLLMPPQPYGLLPEVLASGDVLVALLENGAGAFSVPSKVLTYLCAGRPILGALPAENLAARVLRTSGSGLVTPPGDVEAFTRAACALLDRPQLRRRLGDRGRAYAEANFDIRAIADRFEHLFRRLSAS